MPSPVVTLGTRLDRWWSTFSFVGLATGTLFFAAALTPSLLPRPPLVQGILSGLALAVGYGCGVLGVWLWNYLEIPHFPPHVQRVGKGTTTLAVAVVVGGFLWRAAIWQNSIRERMELAPVESAYPSTVGLIALLTAVVLVVAARAIGRFWGYVQWRVARYVPRRVGYVITTLLVAAALFVVVNDVVLRLVLNAADTLFARLDRIIDDGIEQPTDPRASGSAESLVPWETIGRYGKQFVAAGPSAASIGEFWGRTVPQPLRVYVGLGSRESVAERAELALAELIRAGGFDRKLLIVATPTGTGWLDPGGVDTVEYLHAGETAIVTLQYSYLPSWLTILVDPSRPRESATALFNVVYEHWKGLPRESRPRLYLHGLSLGALGSAASADLFTVFEDPIQGGLWSGPPFPSGEWARAVAARAPESPPWLPQVRDGSLLRFTGRESSIAEGGQRWGPMRFVYIQHASDPMTFFSPELAYRSPDWLADPRGPDVSPFLRWCPLVTCLQLGFDLPLATTVPHGYGHNYAPASYIDGWIAVSEPRDWDEAATTRLKEQFANE